MPRSKITLIKILGSLLIFFGLFKLIYGINGVWWPIRVLLTPSTYNTLSELFFFGGTTLLLSLILPILALVSGFGLIKVKKWGWIWSIIVSLIIFVINFSGTINFAVASYLLRDVPFPEISEDAVVASVSMWPTYIYALISILFVLILTRESVKKNSVNI